MASAPRADRDSPDERPVPVCNFASHSFSPPPRSWLLLSFPPYLSLWYGDTCCLAGCSPPFPPFAPRPPSGPRCDPLSFPLLSSGRREFSPNPGDPFTRAPSITIHSSNIFTLSSRFPLSTVAWCAELFLSFVASNDLSPPDYCVDTRSPCPSQRHLSLSCTPLPSNRPPTPLSYSPYELPPRSVTSLILVSPSPAPPTLLSLLARPPSVLSYLVAPSHPCVAPPATNCLSN